MLGGDFRQTLPVKPGATQSKIINSVIAESDLWKCFIVYKLKENMRLLQANLTTDERLNIHEFSSWLLKLGNGELGDDHETEPDTTKWVKIPQKFLILDNDQGLPELIRFIYDEDTLLHPTPQFLSDRAIVCPKNETANLINKEILELLPGESKTYLSVDSITPFANECGDSDILYPTEYLNTMNFNGLPHHHLELKLGTAIMLLRNLNLVSGLCNGTRMIVKQLLGRVVEAKIITGTRIGEKVFIPRIALTHKDVKLPFIFKRRQFPLRVCYAMTINKIQGQSLNKIGVYLPEPIFSHGQLYVALSRATSTEGLKILLKQQDGHSPDETLNIVYKDFLQLIEKSQV